MPGAKSRVKPLTAGESSGSASDEVSHLELHLQRQLEEDVARIFDESIYSDLEVVCGKLKILTHSCILKARTHQFYHKLEAILRVNIGRDTFDEIYSFISDAYTECNIKQQEKEFINYLNDTLNLEKPVTNNNKRKQKDFADCDAFATPNCISPEKNGFQKTLNLNFSPSTELKKEYYALVPPIENNILEKELKEQDALSTAFKSFIKSQENLNGKQVKQCVKPTSLFLNSSHISKLNKHSNNCDITKQFDIQETKLTKQKDNSHNQINNTSSQIPKNSHIVELEKSAIDISLNNTLDKGVELAYSPDSLVTDEPSSSSDYVSAAYTVSPGVALSGGFSQINVCESITKMDNTTTVSDSGLETTGMLESLNSHKDVTLTDLSLTESTFLDMLNEEAVNSLDTASSTSEIKQLQKFKIFPSQQSVGASSSELEPKDMKSNKPHMITDLSGTSSKEEKQRQNEEIVILESSSLSSETGSWESVFPPKAAETDICQKFINSEREHVYEPRIRKRTTEITSITDQLCPSLVQKSPFKSTSCFIDAASLVDEGDETLTIQDERNEVTETIKPENVSHATCQPITCIRKLAISSEDLSECNEDNEDSLERVDNKDPDSIQKDESPTIFEMTPITEDSLCTNGFDNIPEQQITSTDANTNCDEKTINIIAPHNKLQTVFSSTPNNSIISLRTYDIHDSEESENDSVILRRECGDSLRKQAAESTLKFSESPIISGGVSVEDHLPQFGSYSGSPMCKRKIENIPIVTGAYVPDEEEKPEKSPRPPSNASAWVVDMSSDNKSEVPRINKKPGDKTCENLKQCSRSNSSGDTCKSRSSVDSDSSDRSTQKFYIDLSTLPDALPPEQNNDEDNNEKKNIFSLFIDLGDKSSTVKEMPARLSSSMSKKKTSKTENKSPANKIKPHADASVVKPSDVSDHSMFEKLESLCNDPNISITEIIKNRTNTSSSVNETSDDTRSNQSRSFPKEAVKSIIHEEPVPVNNDNDLFVKLSDLDKPVQTADDIIVPEKTQSFERMTRSIPENHWPDASSTNSRSVDIISSFHSENTLSLNRLFPHLKNDFSRSMPGCLSSRTRSPLRMGVSSSPGDADEHASDMSEMSSVQSSMCRSVVENSTTEDTTSQTASLISSCQSRLGQDLLRMFLEEIAPDVIVEVSGRRIKAHKCILSSRCQYFAGMLSGGWVESAGNVIILPPFSYSVAHFALCHIYSGVSMIPDSISIVELATIADMLGLEGLKEAIMFTLKAKYCHHFHKPCQVCTAGVLECFPLSSVYGLDDLYRKCLRWITRYFHKVWPTKAFATLPSELLDKCYQEHIVNLNADNLVDTVYGCGITVASLHNSRWAEVVGRMCRRVMNAAAQLAASRLVDVLRTMAVMPAAAPAPALQALHDCIHAAIEWAPPDQACKAYAFLSILVNEMRSIHYSQPDLIANGSQTKIVHDNNLLYSHASGWQLQCEGALVRAAPRVVGSQAFKDLPNDLRKRLRELGCIMFGTQALPVTSSPLQSRKTRSPHRSKTSRSHNTGTSRSLDIDQVRASFVPYAPKPQPHVGSLDLLTGAELKPSAKLGKTAPPKVRTTKAQEERAKYNLIKTYQPQERANSKTSSARPTYENTKPRYLEPRVPKEKKFRKPPARMVSSSESSRNSSPLVARAARQHSVNVSHSSRTHVSHDSLATGSRPRTADPSTDSLTDSHNTDKYATYTKTKHVAKRTAPSSQSTKQYMSPTTANKVKITKIPVFLKTSKNTPPSASATTGKVMQKKKCNTTQSTDKLANENGSPLMQSRNRNNERKPSCSLMNATKSSSAKIVPKVMKDTVNNKFSVKQSGKGTAKQGSRSPPPEIPIMERSGTFLKDEPMFGDKTTNIDIDE